MEDTGKTRAKVSRRTVPHAGFSLIELLVVLAILGVLSSIVILAVNPQRQISQASDAAATAHLRALLDAVLQYVTDHQGALPPQLPTSPTVLGNCLRAACPARPAATGHACVSFDLPGIQERGDLVPTYLAEMPKDRREPDPASTGYYLYRSITTNEVVAGSCYSSPLVQIAR